MDTEPMPLKAVLDFVKDVYEKNGLEGMLLILVGCAMLLAVVEFFRAGAGPLGRLRRLVAGSAGDQLDLRKHILFAQLEMLRNSRLGEARVPCPLRQEVFRDAYRLRLEALRDAARKFAGEDHSADTQPELRLAMENMLATARGNWRRAASELGLPPPALDLYDAASAPLREVTMLRLRAICESTVLYDTNDRRAYGVFEELSCMEPHFMDKLVETLLAMNGTLSKCAYNGVECSKCASCPSDKARAELADKLQNGD
jgi:hypothetical protein